MRSVQDVLDCLARVRGDQYGRMSCYQRQSNAYFGVSSARQNTAMDTTGRPILRMGDLRSELRMRSGAPNLIQPIVDDMSGLKGKVPLQRVVPTSEDASALELAQKQTYLLKDVWERSAMDVQQRNAGFYLSCLGDVIYTLDPLLPDEATDLEPPGVYITVHSPRLAYYRFRGGRYSQELAELWLTWQQSALEAASEFCIDLPGDPEKSVDVVVYYDKDCKQVLVDEKRVLAVEHNLGWVPAQWVPNKMAGDMKAQADISQAVEVHEEVQSLFLILGDATAEAVYAPIKVRDADNVAGDAIELGPRAVISVTATGDVTRVEPAPPPTAAQGLLQTLQEALFHVTGTTPVRVEGQMPGSNISGRMVHSVQQPQESRVNTFQDIIGHHIERLDQKILLMYGKIPELAGAELNIQGSDKGKPYSITTKGSDLGGTARVEIKWDALIGSSKHERLVMALQAFAQGLVPGSYVIEQLGEDDPDAILKKAQLEKIMIQQYAQGLQPPPPAGGPPGPGGQSGPGPGGDPGAQQQHIMQPMQGNVAGAEGGNPAAGGGGPPGGPGGGPPPVQPGPPPGPSLAPFGHSPQGPAPQGMGPKPQTPDVLALARKAVNSLPAEVQSDVVWPPAMEGTTLVVYTRNARHIPSGIIKRAFRDVGLPMEVKVKVAA